jgi:hypothetical protein
VGAGLRLYGLQWDAGHWLHPDERQIYFVATELGWPTSLAQALSPDSPLNPGFFAYGSLPIYLVRTITGLLAPLWPTVRDLDNLHLVGRPLAVLFDLGTIYLTYRLARALLSPTGRDTRPELGRTPGQSPAGEHLRLQAMPEGTVRCASLVTAALVSVAVLHVQLARFYTVDPLLTFFVLLTLNLAVDVARGGGRRRQVALGIAFGLAVATKVTAGLLILVILVAYLAQGAKQKADGRTSGAMSQDGQARIIIGKMVATLAIAASVFVIVQPYAVIDWRTFVDHTLRESQIAWGALDVPYTRQYAGTLPYLYSMWQTALWGVALPLGLVAWAGFAVVLVRWLRRAPWSDTLLLAWAGPYFAITGLLYARYLRYMMPLLPILCLGAVMLLARARWRRVREIGYWVLGIGALVYALAFARIYGDQHPWIAASEWIYQELPAESTLAVEDWDTALPLPLEIDGYSRRIDEYDVRTLMLYDEPDDGAKWGMLATDLADSDYVILASRRLYGSIPRLPERYPVTTRYYEHLMDGSLGFALAGEFTRGPAWLNPRVSPLPDAAPALLRPDESFVVYDHPRVLIYRNVERLLADELLRRLGMPG